MTKPKTIFFDWHNTLCSTYFWFNIEQRNQISQILFKEHPQMVTDWMLGKYTSEDICKYLGNKLDIEPETLLKELRNDFKLTKFADPQVIPLIQELREKGIKCVIATDNMDCFNRFAIPYMGLEDIFDDFLNSFYLKHFKYDYDNGLPFFEKYLEDNGLEYNNVVLIDDSIDKKGNFERVGFEIINIASPLEVRDILRRYLET